ncbi:MAG: HEPN domain-containing protein [Nanoarchaeota archaeon]
MSKLDDCFGKGLLRKSARQPDLAGKDLRLADFYLNEAADLLEMGKKVMASLALYNAFFHCARALLFHDGLKERSHYCIARYIEEVYVGKKRLDIRFLNAFETIMSIRNNAQYSTEEITIEEDLEELYNICEAFIEQARKIIQEKVVP